jgi:meso-butanediol dehydrogenase / (S,S)-butanediol dehydrogenase / diacetyl reductase
MADRRTALVTGGARGIGKGIATRLAQDGLAVSVADLPSMQEENEATAQELRDLGVDAVALEVDVADPASQQAMIAAHVEALGDLDVMVANAGVAKVASLLDTDLETYDWLMSINQRGVFISFTEAARQMIDQGHGGKIIGACSIAGHKGFAMLGTYSMTKWGVRALTQAAAQEWAPHGITVNSYCPGIVGTAMWDLIDEQIVALDGREKGAALKEFSGLITLGRVQTPEDVAQYVSYLASRDSDYMTGQSVMIDGGVLFS